MCGIAGFTQFKTQYPDPEVLARSMGQALAHRGPDGAGCHVDSSVALAHQRLSIIDLAGGAQPMHSPCGRYTLVYNGELYNYRELRARFEREGRVFSTDSDTEVLLAGLVQEGVESLRRFNGMFAFALWDKQEKTLLLARDRLGIKPLFYAVEQGDLVFASELKALECHPGWSRELDRLSISKYLTYTYIPAPHTIYECAQKLEPAHWIRFSERGLEGPFMYWDIPLEDSPISTEPLDECAARVRALLEDAVVKRLRSDVPLGVFLSGGIDSSAIAALAARHVPDTLHTFSVGFEESSFDESEYARLVAERCGTQHHHEVLSSARALELLPGVLDHMDEPFADASLLPTSLLSQFTARQVKVALGGDGGDEVFVGYPSFQAHRVMERLSFLPPVWRDQLNRLARKLPVSHRYASLEYLLNLFFRGAGVSPEIRFFLWMGCSGNEEKRTVLSPAFQQELLRSNPFEDVINLVRQSGLYRDFERLQYLCMKLYMQDGILTKVDRASMHYALEVRVPFLDHELVEYAATIHPDYKMNGLKTKYILKHAVRDLLPPKIIKRRKAGFMIPLASWLSHELRPMLEEYCSEEALTRDGIFDPGGVRRLLDEHFAQKRDHRKLIWAILCFQYWRRHHVG